MKKYKSKKITHQGTENKINVEGSKQELTITREFDLPLQLLFEAR